MARYILRRLLWMIPIILGVSLLVFTLMFFCPGDPARIILGQGATQAEIVSLRETMGLNRGYFPRLFEFLVDTFVHGDLGSSYISKAPIAAEIAARLPQTLILATLFMLSGVLVGVPLGIIAAVKQDSIIDRLCMVIAMLGASVPNFWLALLLILLFAVNLGILPAMGMGGPIYYILPTLSGAMGCIAVQARQSRSSMLEVIRSDYVTTARSKGVGSMGVIFKHELPNALIPVITCAGNDFGNSLGGALIIEQIFSISGMGEYMVQAVFNRDYPVVQASAIFMAIAFSLIMLLVDLGYAFVDPRIKAQYEGKPLFKRKEKVPANE